MSNLSRGEKLRRERFDAADRPNTKSLAQDQFSEFQEVETRYEANIHSIHGAEREFLHSLQRDRELYEKFGSLP